MRCHTGTEAGVFLKWFTLLASGLVMAISLYYGKMHIHKGFEMEVVEIDGSGRLYIPVSIRRRVPWRRFRIEVEGDRLILTPVKPAVDKYYGIAAPAKLTSPEEIDDAVKIKTEKILEADLR